MASKLGALSVFLTADTSPFARKMKNADGSVKKLGASTAAFGAAAAAAFGMAAVKLKDFTAEALTASKRFAEVNTLLQLEPKGLEVLKNELFDISSELGIMSEDAIPALYQAISAGVPRENVIDFLKVAGKSAKAGVTTMETSVDGLTSIIDAYSLSVEDAEMVSDKFLSAVDVGKTKFELLADGVGKVAPMASQLNVSLDELFGIMVSLTKVGLKTDEAFTGFRGILTAMVKPSDDLTKQLEQLGKEGKASDIKTDGLVNVMKALQKAVNNDAQALAKLFPKVRGLNAAFAVLKNEAKQTAGSIDASRMSAEKTNKMFQKIADDESFGMEQASANWEQIKINIGDIVKESGFISFLTKASGLVRDISKDTKSVVGKQFKTTGKEDQEINSVISGKKSKVSFFAKEIAKIVAAPFTKTFTLPVDLLESGAARRVEEAETKRVNNIIKDRERRKTEALAEGKARRKKLQLEEAQEAERLAEKTANMFKNQSAGEGGDIMRFITSEKDTEKANQAFTKKIKNMKLELKLSKMIAEGRQKEAFILERTAAFGKDITKEQRTNISKLAGALFDIQNIEKASQMEGPALSEAIRAGSQQEAALLARAMVPETEKKLMKKNVDANIATANELKIQNERGVKFRGMKVVYSVK
jgi:TP901 family phage tail tape measure protein